jgi:uncharacterized membrane-anchored protein
MWECYTKISLFACYYDVYNQGFELAFFFVVVVVVLVALAVPVLTVAVPAPVAPPWAVAPPLAVEIVGGGGMFTQAPEVELVFNSCPA